MTAPANPMTHEEGKMRLETAWLVEKPNGIMRAVSYWNGVGFALDANEALRFARKEDAQRALDLLVPLAERPRCYAREHGWYPEAQP